MWWGSGNGNEPTADSPAFVTIKCSQSGVNLFQLREAHLDDEELKPGYLPLIVLALQEAIRVGVERGSLPEILGDATVFRPMC
jgi:hypothetical protein